MFTVALKKEVTGGYSVRCVELPAAISQGETEEEAVRNAREAIELVLEELEARASAETRQAGTSDCLSLGFLDVTLCIARLEILSGLCRL